MKIKFAILSGLLLLSCQAYSQIITGFGTGDFTVTFSDFSTSQSASALTITGLDAGDSLYGNFSTVVIGAAPTLSLLGTKTTTVSSNFQIEIFDASDNSRLYQGSLASFVQNTETNVALTFLSESGVFNGTAVRLGFLTTGSGSNVGLTMNTLSAVPEPATWALLAGSLTTVMIFRRRRSKF
jgi:hypothetical protein